VWYCFRGERIPGAASGNGSPKSARPTSLVKPVDLNQDRRQTALHIGTGLTVKGIGNSGTGTSTVRPSFTLSDRAALVRLLPLSTFPEMLLYLLVKNAFSMFYNAYSIAL
jgi:hypothetical protein